MKKRVLSILLAVVMVMSMAVPAFAAVANYTLIREVKALVCDDATTGRYHIDLTKLTNPTQEALVTRWQQIKRDMSDPNRNVVIYFYWCKAYQDINFISYPKDGITTKVNEGSSSSSLTATVADTSQIRAVTFKTYADTTRPNNFTNGYYEIKDNYVFATGCTIGYYGKNDAQKEFKSFAYFTGENLITDDRFYYTNEIKHLEINDNFPDLTSHTLTVNYQYEDGSQAIDSVVKKLGEGTEYNIPSPFIDGCTPDRLTVIGTMGAEDITETVVYRKTSHTLTVNYQYEDGRRAAPSVTNTLKEGATYNVPSPIIEGYTPDLSAVIGTMGTEDIIKTVVYHKTSHTLTIHYQYENGSQAATSVIKSIAEGAAYSVASPIVEGYTPNKPTVSGTMGTADITETVVYSKTAHTLTINYQYADGGQAVPSATRSLADGDTYAVASPTIEGYTPDRAVVAGFMGAADKTETVTYNKNSHTLTVNYQYEDGSKVADPVTQTVEYGASYSVPSPSITGYKPDRATVSGTMPDQDVTATVTYISQSSNLTIVYQYEDGSQAAPTYTAELAEGSTYEVRSPDIKGYTPDKEFVSGTVPEGGVTVTVTYKAVKHTLTVNYQYEDGSPASETVTQSLASGERYEIASPVIDGYKPSTATVTGFMPSRDKTILVTYTKESSSSGGSTPPPKPGGDWEYHDPWAKPGPEYYDKLFNGYKFRGPTFDTGITGSGGKHYPWDGIDQDQMIRDMWGGYECTPSPFD